MFDKQRKKALVILACLGIFVTLSACGNLSDGSGEEAENQDPLEGVVEAGSEEGSTEESTGESDYTFVNEGALWGTESDQIKVEILSYEFDENWHSYADVDEGPAVIVRIYFENDGEDPLYMYESFAIDAYQDGVELDYISLNSDDEECTNVAKSIKDGASLYCKLAFQTISNSDVELLVYGPSNDYTTPLTEIVVAK